MQKAFMSFTTNISRNCNFSIKQQADKKEEKKLFRYRQKNNLTMRGKETEKCPDANTKTIK